MLLPTAYITEVPAFEPEPRHPVADLLVDPGRGRSHQASDGVESGLHLVGERGDVLVNGGEWRWHRGRRLLARLAGAAATAGG